MPIVNGGLFIFLLVIGFAGLFGTKTFHVVFAIIGAIAFFTLAIFMFANYDVAFVTEYNDGTTQWNQTNYILGTNDTGAEDEQKIWVGWIFVLLALLTISVFFIELFKPLIPKASTGVSTL